MHAARYIEMQRGYIFDEHLVVCEYSMYCIVCARIEEYFHAGHSRAMIYGHGRLPGSAAPRSRYAPSAGDGPQAPTELLLSACY